MNVRKRAWRITARNVLKIGPSPVPLWISFVLAVFVTVSAFDDARLFLTADQSVDNGWLKWAGTIAYWAVWMALAFLPRAVAPLFVAMLLVMLLQTQSGGPLLLAFAALAVSGYRASTRSVAVMVSGFLVWQIVWVLAVAHLGSTTLWAYVPTTLLLVTPGLAIKMLRERAVQAERARHTAEEESARAALEQRTALARELHDVVTHGLTMIAVQANLGALSRDSEEKNHALGEIGGMARSSLDDLRLLLQTMRTEDSAALELKETETRVKTSPAVIDLAECVADSQKRLNNLGFPTRIFTSGDLAQTPKGLRPTVQRVLQEGATNAIKHTGGGSECEISLSVHADRLELVMKNQLTPGKPRLPVSGTGLVGLRERISRLGGTIDTGPKNGWWILRMEVPFTAR